MGKVLAEQGHLRQVADGRSVAVNASNNVPSPPMVAPAPKADDSEQAKPPTANPSAPVVADERVAMLSR